MLLPAQLLRETEERCQVRRESREEHRQKFVAGEVLEANSMERVQKRLERLARAEAPAVATVAPLSAITVAPLDAKDPFGTALERVIGKSDLIGINYLDLS